MKRTRLLLLPLAILVLMVGIPIFLTRQQVRQDQLNQALISAVKQSDTKTVVSLLDQGADANCHDDPPQHVALWKMVWDRLTGKHPRPSTGPTPLYWAMQVLFPVSEKPFVLSKNLPLIKALLDHKANVNVHNQDKETPLLLAIMQADKATVHLLLKYGADMKPDLVNNMAPLVLATDHFNGSTDVIADMLQRGADVNQRDANGDTALCEAVSAAHVEAVRVLLSYHADVTLKGGFGDTPLAQAKLPPITPEPQQIVHRKQQIIRLLQQAGAKQ